MPAVEILVLPFLNRLLDQEDWARQRLLPYVGQMARIEGGPINLTLTVDERGLFSAGASDLSPCVTIAFGNDAPVKLLTDPANLFASARISGTANFAETLAFVFRNLRWDYESDLAGLVGDIAARRFSHLLAIGGDWQRSTARRIGANLSEYATEDSRLLPSNRQIARFCTDVDLLRDDLARLEKRLVQLSA